ncbi:TDG/mug DNA glycosylase family protein [Paenibacillus phyllosphaerae]|uniref:TDG/mug DNA glycosylase family protein n=1 Tax=Paenibacillus phyllosphaerae TaxID=274593 RepID=A0A7W5FS46_9BACL|nr:DNA-deoxyinosine glycosylase [Paenibacillus phyllosphaerae]MBB3114659.1 TDG/mug DNA glycosylase family protein [Paenibacillus phyllosphaerae]
MHVMSFEPFINEEARVLVMGSMPGAESLMKQQYYGNMRNHFWGVMYGLFAPGTKPAEAYEDRLAFAARHRIAMWDVIANCDREGSLDANIKDAHPNDIPGLIARYPNIKCLAFNGGKAYDTFKKHYGKHPELSGLPQLRLPSTSPIPTKAMRNTEDRIGAWQVLVPYVDRA